MALRLGAALLLSLLAASAIAGDDRARVNYLIHCQGCHLPGAIGHAGKVPRMQGFLGYFLHSSDGREFLVRVPGVSTSTLPDDQLAELLNWLLVTYSADELPATWARYTAAEVASLRGDPVQDPETVREHVLADIARAKPELRSSLRPR